VRTPSSRAADVWTAIATAIGIVALTLPMFLNPIWVGFEQERAQATAWTGFSEADLRTATYSILADLVFGPPDFDAEVAGTPVLEERERAHMRDVRGVFMGFFVGAAVLVAVGILLAARRQPEQRTATWRAVRTGALGLLVTLLVSGVVAVVAFDALFEVFHRLLFAGGSYTFDPRTERLVQLFPFQFWQETAIAVGVVAIGVALIVAAVAQRRLVATPVQRTGPATFESSRP
jgi:integral membrane protein (TIGR01906 family)